ncbi:prolyl oligopeptidase family serine peptidase [Cellulophaga baltica]|uniref:prolyl oligopeptidase family serine peptidase n=1 Tax=Cellulophaga baltica TaxID=76594 RepID=UPI000402C4B2|nr:prolyl oligopeptidase family serine peptidase [Cellulophaga baltica]
MKTRLHLFFTLFLVLSATAQTTNEESRTLYQTLVSGTVVEAASNAPLSYAYITIGEVGLGTVTDGDGNFEITIPNKYDAYPIKITYLGFEDLQFTVADFRTRSGQIIQMTSEAVALNEIVLKPEKMPSAKALLKKVIKKIPTNYTDTPANITGYYRETMKENGVYIKYSDAVCTYYETPYMNANYKWKDYQNPFDLLGNGMLNFDTNSLHRIHFHHKTLKEEQVHIVKARASSSLSKKEFHANIEGGPLGLLARNRVKYQESFLGKKASRDFNFTVSEELDETGTYVYVLDFHTKTTKAQLDAIETASNRRQWRTANNRKLLKGRIYIDREDLAILRYECAVPNDLKQYFCGYDYNQVKHFDYKLDVRFKKREGKYLIAAMRHEDEFIYKDSISQATTYYSAISEFKTTGTNTKDIKKFSEEENFANTMSNQLYELPLDYDADFWQVYSENNAIAAIDTIIRRDMQKEAPLEQQFRDKHIRNDAMPAPIAKIVPSSFKIHGENYTDNYAWLKDTQAPSNNTAVMEYLRQENKYTANYNIPLKRAQRTIYKELIKGVEENSTSLPIRENGYLYYSAFTEEDEHPIYYRKAVENDTVVEKLLDVTIEAKDKAYYNAGIGAVSPNNQFISIYENTTGKDAYVLKIKDLKTQTYLADSIAQIGSMVWLDNASFLYVNRDEKTLNSSKVLRHVLGTAPENDVIVYQEEDPSFSVSIQKSKSKEYIFLNTGSSTTSENWYLETKEPMGAFKVIQPREKNHIYGTAQHKELFYIITNKEALNYKVVAAPIHSPSAENWVDIIPHQTGVLIQDFQLFDDYLVINEKEKAQGRIKVLDLATKNSHFLKLDEEFYNVTLGYNPDFKTDSLQFNYSSFETPLTTFNYHMKTKEKRMVKQHSKPITLPYFKYVVERKWVTAKDGKQIPLTLISSKWRAKRKGDNYKVYLSSYGAYGAGQDIASGPKVHHLVNAGFVYAIAHVRGGNDLGNEWYEDGKLFHKKNTFSDFIACAEYLIENNYAKEGSIVAEGASAGGLLMGAVVNERPELFKTVLLDVPFVDVVNTMLDETLPLTIGEYDEWGNPQNKKQYGYIKSYSPYDNVKAQAYPNLLFFTGLNDTRVGYWEPAKMVAKLRATKTDDHILLLKTDFSSGHSGGSGRFSGYRDSAYKLALIYDLNKPKEVDK